MKTCLAETKLSLSTKPLRRLLCTLAFAASSTGLASPAMAEGITVRLEPGHWVTQQSIIINGREIPAFQIDNGNCLEEEDANQTVQQYFERLVAAANEDDDVICTFTDPVHGIDGIRTNLECNGTNGAKTEGTLTYTPERTRVDYHLEGKFRVLENSPFMDLLVTGHTRKLGECQ